MTVYWQNTVTELEAYSTFELRCNGEGYLNFQLTSIVLG